MMIKKIKICTETGKAKYTLRAIAFNPTKRFVSTPEAKDMCRKDMHCSKKKMEEEYDSVYASWMRVGHGRYTHIEFNKTNKAAANIIFVIPKKYRREAVKQINHLEVFYDKLFFK